MKNLPRRHQFESTFLRLYEVTGVQKDGTDQCLMNVRHDLDKLALQAVKVQLVNCDFIVAKKTEGERFLLML